MSPPVHDVTQMLAEEPRLRALARRLAVDADDVVQETYLRVLQWGAVAAPEPRAWIARVARNIAVNLRRGEHRRALREQRMAKDLAAPSPAELAVREERRAALVAAVDALPAMLRTLVWLRFFEGLPPRRIAARLGLPAMTVSNHLRRALQMLRARLDAEHGDRRAWLLPLCFTRPRSVLPLATTGVIAMTKTKTLAAAAALLALVATYASWPTPVLEPVASDIADAASMTAAFTAEPIEPRYATTQDAPELPSREHVATPATTRTPSEPDEKSASGTVTMRGRVLDENGRPFSDVTVSCIEDVVAARAQGKDPTPPSQLFKGITQADAEGRFAFDACPAGSLFVVQLVGWEVEAYQRTGVDPTARELVLQGRRTPAGSMRIRGRVVGADGVPIISADVHFSRVGPVPVVGGGPLTHTGEDGAFSMELKPGTWRVWVSAGRHANWSSDAREVAADTTWDLGSVQLSRGSACTITIVGADFANAYLSVADRALTRWFWGGPVKAATMKTDPLPPGDYVLLWSSPGTASHAVPFTMRAGEDNRVEVQPQPGVRQRIELVPPGEFDAAHAQIFVHRASEPVRSMDIFARSGEPVTAELWLAPGRYTITARFHDWQGQAACTIGAEESAPLRIALQ